MSKKGFMKNSLISMIEQGFSSIASFLTGIIIARGTNTDDVGTYALILSISFILMGLQRVIIAVPFNVYLHKISNEVDKKNYISATSGMELIFLALIMILSFSVSGLKLVPASIDMAVLAVFFAGTLLKDYARQYFFGIDKVTICLFMSSLQCIIQIILLFSMLYFKTITLPLCLLIIGLSCIVIPIGFLIFNTTITLKKDHMLNAWNRNRWTVKWSIGISMSDAVKNQISVWLLNFFVSLSAVGIFTNNNTLAMLPQPVFNGLSQYLLPNFSKLYAEKEYVQIRKKSLYSITLVCICNIAWLMIIIFFGNRLVELIYGREYITITSILIFCCLRGLFTSLSSITSSILQAIEKPYSIVTSLILAIITMCTIGAFLTWRYQILGMSIAMVIMFVISTVAQVFAITRYFKVRS